MAGVGMIVAVVPVKDMTLAKRRLSSRYSPAFRRRLAEVMLEDVLAALTGSAVLADVVLVTEDPTARDMAKTWHARVIDDGARDGHTGAVTAAIRRLGGAFDGMLTMPGDVPLTTSEEVDSLLEGHGPAPAFSIVPAHDGRGSNAIVMTPMNAVPLAFGDDSFGPHVAAARSMAIEPRIVDAKGIGLDIDHPDDLARFMNAPSQTRTWEFLAEQMLVSRETSAPSR
jgi:2-phospho-L-lactate guanylyltransferase